MWIIIIILAIIVFLYINNQTNKANEAKAFIAEGGFRKSFPVLTKHLIEEYQMEFVNDTGRGFTFAKNVKDKYGNNAKLFIGVQLEFSTPILFSKFINNNKQEVSGTNVSNFNYQDITEIDRCIDISIKPIKSLFENITYLNTSLKKEIISEATIKKVDKITLPLISEVFSPNSITLRTKAKELLLTHDYIKRYFGEDIDIIRKNQPTDDDIKLHQKIINKLDAKAKDNFVRIMNNPSEIYADKINLTYQEIEKLKELNKKLNDWSTLLGTINSDGKSLADILIEINNLEKESDNKNNFISGWKDLEKRTQDKTGEYTIFVNIFFIPDLINREKFIGNLCLLRGSMNPNHGTDSAKLISEKPKGFSELFLAGYPDVFNWTQNNFNNDKIKALVKLQNLSDKEAQEYFNDPQKLYKFYRKLIDQYKNENYNLECAQ